MECQDTAHYTDDVHPSVGIVFRTENILEKVCSYLGWNDLKQFRLLSRTCNNEGRRALIKRDGHWVVVKSKDYDGWQRELNKLLRKLEKKASAGGEDSNKILLGWIFKRLQLVDWEYALERPFLLRQWGRYLRKIHLNTDNKESHTFNASHVIKTMHNLLSVCCPNLDEMVVVIEYLKNVALPWVLIEQLDDLEFSSPLLKLKCLRIMYRSETYFHGHDIEVLQRFFTRLVIAAGSALENLDIHYDTTNVDLEKMMLDSISLNVGVSNFQCLQEFTLQSASNVSSLSHTVQKCFPKLIKLTLRNFDSEVAINQVFPESFPALKALTLHYVSSYYITHGDILYFLQHFPNLEVLKISTTESWLEIPEPIAPRYQSLRSLTFTSEDYDLCLLRCVVKHFPNIVSLNLLEFGKGNTYSVTKPEYSFGELMDAISSLTLLQQLYVNHAFHTSPQLVDAIQLTSNFTALQTFILSQAAHTIYRFNVSLYLTSSDPEFLYILDCECVRRLQSVRLLNFRFGTRQEEVEEEAAAKGGHVSFGTICPCYYKPWICDGQSRLKPCHHSESK